MKITHHLTDQILMAHAAGTLPEAFALVVATHVSMCDDCRAHLGAFEAVGGVMMETCGTAQMSDGCLDRVLARLTSTPDAPAAGAACAQSQSVAIPKLSGAGGKVATAPIFPAPLRDYIGGDLADVRWRAIGLGMRQAVLQTAAGATARLLHIPAGQAMPDHGHQGLELTLVLDGAFCDDGIEFLRGDIDVADCSVDHVPSAGADRPCICLTATDAPLRFNGFLPRLAQPFLGI